MFEEVPASILHGGIAAGRLTIWYATSPGQEYRAYGWDSGSSQASKRDRSSTAVRL